MKETTRFEVTGVPAPLAAAAEKRAKKLGQSRSSYLRWLMARDCEEAGLWPPPKTERR